MHLQADAERAALRESSAVVSADEERHLASLAQPLQAALSSALSFAAGALVPIAATLLAPTTHRLVDIFAASIFALVLLAWLTARTGHAPTWPSIRRITVWGTLAMAVTMAVGFAFDAAR